MNRTFTKLVCLIAVVSSITSKIEAQTTYVDNGTTTNYDLKNGDSLYIASGTFTGTITNFHKGAKITVAPGANFFPASFNSPHGKLTVMGVVRLSSIAPGTDFVLNNYNMFEVTGTTTMSGGGQTWNNFYGGTLKFGADVTMNNNSVVNNDGTITALGNFTMNNGAEITNDNTINITGVFTSNSGDIDNFGKLSSDGGITFNSGTDFTNTCRIVSNGDITINNMTLYNNGLVWLTAKNAGTKITNSGTIVNSANAAVKAVNFTNYGAITGSGYYYFTGITYNSGNVGVTGTTTDVIRIFDATRTNPATIFDTQYGSVRPNAVFSNFAAPDTTGPVSGCAPQYLMALASLPVTWKEFTVKLNQDIPVLHWSAEQDPNTVYEIQRSYNGVNYTSITSITIPGKTADQQYEDHDKNNKDYAVVYYRIKGTTPLGEQKYSDVKTVRFAVKAEVTARVNPNPFSTQLNITFTSDKKETLSIRIHNINGQVSLVKKVAINAGNNTITLTEASQFARGIYLVEVSTDSRIISTQKLFKQ